MSSKYVSVRQYEVKDSAEVARIAKAGFIDLLKNIPGFIHYEFIAFSQTKLMTLSYFDTKEGAEASLQIAREWGKTALAHLVVAPLEMTIGEVIASS